jgi:hypothetical protein
MIKYMLYLNDNYSCEANFFFIKTNNFNIKKNKMSN